MANPHIGSGLVAGSGNALEYDEEGNIVGLDTDGFVKGFLAGAVSSKIGAAALKKHNPKLYNKILGVSKEFPNMATSNPKLLAEIYKTAPTAKGQALTFAGEKAIKADVAKLDDAKKMAEDGAKEADIWRSTGWFKGDDGKWRFELDDSGAEMLKTARTSGSLKDFIRHDKLFENYPQLKDIDVLLDIDETIPKSKSTGIYQPYEDRGEDFFPLFEEIRIKANNTDEAKSTLLHEVQHAVQEIENFAKGTNAQSSGFDNYLKSHGETEARLTQIRAENGYENFPYDDLDVPRDELIIRDGEGVAEMSIEARTRYIDARTGDVNLKALRGDAELLPQRINDFNDFKKRFPEADKNGDIKLISKNDIEVEFNLEGAWKHFRAENNTHFDDRFNFSGAFEDVLREPLLVVKEPHKGRDLVFYKPFKDEKGLYHLASVKFTNGKFTFFDLSPLNKVKEIINATDLNTLYFKCGRRGTHQADEHTTRQMSVLTPTHYSNRNRFSEHNYPKPTTQKQDELAESGATSGKAVSGFIRNRSDHDSMVKSYSIQKDEGVASINGIIAKEYKDSQGFYSVLEKTIDEKVGGKIANEEYLPSVNTQKPVIQAEIKPSHFEISVLIESSE